MLKNNTHINHCKLVIGKSILNINDNTIYKITIFNKLKSSMPVIINKP